ncbi:glycolate oxidase [Rhodococcus sp. 27YEA15]|uniref:FAD-binding oxidoreductase n=1 Tax=Rhodococcus sp. 27YEA15 TaxID=3156259 RepID=UPI003C7ECB5C
MKEHLRKRLCSIVGDENVLTSLNALNDVSVDRANVRLPGMPLAEVRPGSVAELRDIVKTATVEGIIMVPRGAGTGLAGGVSAPAGSLVVSTTRLRHIGPIDPIDHTTVVGAGVRTADLDAAAAKHGLMYAPDPSSARYSTIGGNVATNAGGLRCAKYGVTRESVLALRVVLTGGRLLETGHRTLKGVAGFDLTSLFVGSEGTLGVVAEVTVRLYPRPARTRWATAYFRDLGAAEAALNAVARSEIRPAALELLDSGALREIDRDSGTALAIRGAALVLAQTDGLAADAELAVLAEHLRTVGGAVDVLNDAEAHRYSELRRCGRSVPADRWSSGGDIAVPRSQVVAGVRQGKAIARARGLEFSVVAHAADGNLHPSFTLAKSEELSPPSIVTGASGELFDWALSIGGTITGEHGVGLVKRAWISKEIGPLGLALQREVKRVFDPENLFNPHTWLAAEAADEK